MNPSLAIFTIGKADALTTSAGGDRLRLIWAKTGFIPQPAISTFCCRANDIGLAMSRTRSGLLSRMPLGLLEHYCPSVALYYQCLGECQLAKIAASDFENILSFVAGLYARADHDQAYMGIFALDAHYERGSQTSFQTIKSMLSRYLYRGEIDALWVIL